MTMKIKIDYYEYMFYTLPKTSMDQTKCQGMIWYLIYNPYCQDYEIRKIC